MDDVYLKAWCRLVMSCLGGSPPLRGALSTRFVLWPYGLATREASKRSTDQIGCLLFLPTFSTSRTPRMLHESRDVTILNRSRGERKRKKLIDESLVFPWLMAGVLVGNKYPKRLNCSVDLLKNREEVSVCTSTGAKRTNSSDPCGTYDCRPC